VADPHYYYSYQAAKLKARGDIKKLVSTWWETIPFNNESTSAKKKIKQFTMKYVDHFLCYSVKAKRCLVSEGVSEKSISFIPLGVDITAFHPATRKENDIFTILFVGRLVEEKGIMDLYYAFKQLIIEKKKIKLEIVGRGPRENKLRSLMQQDGLQNRVTIEHKPYQEMPDMFRHADILCVPSKKTGTWEEQYGMVFIEAMASGLPIVSYTTGAIPELVQDSGLLANNGNIPQLTKLLGQLHSDSQLRCRIGTMGRERAERLYDAKKTRERISKLYEILNSKL